MVIIKKSTSIKVQQSLQDLSQLQNGRLWLLYNKNNVGEDPNNKKDIALIKIYHLTKQ